MTDPFIGRVLDGRYKVLDLLGSGGMGAVYRAQRLNMGDEVAVKVLSLSNLPGTSAQQAQLRDILSRRFRREAQAAVALNYCPNVVTIHDVGPDYYVMELLRGEDLQTLLRREKALPLDRAIALFSEICVGVGEAHRQNILHRDLKPANVFVLPPDAVRGRNLVKVVDFGLVKILDNLPEASTALTNTGQAMGTGPYMPPEQWEARTDIDKPADVYSLGIMLYEMLAGALPFHAANFAGYCTQHLFQEPPPLPASLGVPPEVETVIRRALAKKPEQRPPDATVLAREVRAAWEKAQERERQQAEAVRQQREQAERRQRDDTMRRQQEEIARLRRGMEASQRRAQPLAVPPGPAVEKEPPRVAPQRPLVNPPPQGGTTIAWPPPQSGTTNAATNDTRRKWLMGVGGAILALILGVGGVKYLSSSGGVISDGGANVKAGPTVKNNLGMEFAQIPAGMFQMGDSDEKPVHSVTISKPFSMQTTEVTQAQWEAVMGSNPSRFKDCPTCPVETVSWDDAQAFIQKLNERNDGFAYRLPTEAQWEYAARAGTTGDYAGNLDEMGWYYENSGDKRLDDATWSIDNLTKNNNKTHPVGEKKANKFGLYGMHGNVWEWVQDWYGPYNGNAVTDPSGPTSGSARVLRGGGWRYKAVHCRSAQRDRNTPDARDCDLGFGLSRTPA